MSTRLPLCRLCRLACLAVFPVLLPAAGCVGWSYDRVQLGAERREYERVFPGEWSRRSDLGLCVLGRCPLGGTDVVVLVTTRDRRVAAKFHARRVERSRRMGGESRYELRGEVNPVLADLSATGPIDALRSIANDLAEYQGEKLASEAHAWVAAGLVRIAERWPYASDLGPAAARVAEMLERVPGGGEALVSVDRHGVYHFEYRCGQQR